MTGRRRLVILGSAVLTVLLASCGGSESTSPQQPAPTISTSTPTSPASSVPSSTPTSTAGPEYVRLREPALVASLLTLEALPVGYSQDPATTDSGNKTFCDYKPPFTETEKVRRDFTKGGGISAEFVSVGLRQYEDSRQAAAGFKALTNALKTCTGEVYNGSRLTYSVMSSPAIGDGSIGVRIESDSYTLLQFFALVGPTLVNAGGGGITNANADEVVQLLKAQVESYQQAATR